MFAPVVDRYAGNLEIPGLNDDAGVSIDDYWKITDDNYRPMARGPGRIRRRAHGCVVDSVDLVSVIPARNNLGRLKSGHTIDIAARHIRRFIYLPK